MTDSYACTFSGECEPDPYGQYSSLSSCTTSCKSSALKDVQYKIFTYSPEEALHLAPQDRVEVIKRLTSAKVNPSRSREILLYLGTRNLAKLLTFPELRDYVFSNYSREDISSSLMRQGDEEATTYIRDYNLNIDPKVLALNLLRNAEVIPLSQMYSKIWARGYHLNNVSLHLLSYLNQHPDFSPGSEILEYILSDLEEMNHDTQLITNPYVIAYIVSTGFWEHPMSWFHRLVSERQTSALEWLASQGYQPENTYFLDSIRDRDTETLQYLDSLGFRADLRKLSRRLTYRTMCSYIMKGDLDYYLATVPYTLEEMMPLLSRNEAIKIISQRSG